MRVMNHPVRYGTQQKSAESGAALAPQNDEVKITFFSSFAYLIGRVPFNDEPIPIYVFLFKEGMHFFEALFRYPFDTIHPGRCCIIKSRQGTKFFYHLKDSQFRMRFLCYRNSHVQ